MPGHKVLALFPSLTSASSLSIVAHLPQTFSRLKPPRNKLRNKV